ncbi:MAG: Aerobic cobaltochelatase subunit CobT [Hyphomicrobiaceae bacterium hypho_1]
MAVGNNYKNRSTDNLKRAIQLTARAVTGDEEVQVTYEASRAEANGKVICLPELPSRPTEREISIIRGWADSLSMLLACHDEKLHRKHLPTVGVARDVFDALEFARVEALGCNRMLGMAINLTAKTENKYTKDKLKKLHNSEHSLLEDALVLIVRERLTGLVPPDCTKSILNVWREWVERKAGSCLKRLDFAIEDQEQFSRGVLDLLNKLELLEEKSETNENVDTDYRGNTDYRDNHSDDKNQPNQNLGENSEEKSKGEQACEELTTPSKEDETENVIESIQTSEAEIMDDDQEFGGNDDSQISNVSVLNSPEAFGYKVYTRAYDEEILAEDLSTPEELERLRTFLDKELHSLSGATSRLANKLQRKLMAHQNRSWEFDLEEGVLDAARLTRIIVDPMQPLSYKRESDINFRDTIVTLLLDNSGSMRGRPIIIAATCADILARTLERCSVKVEILGFTTKAWKGGRSREKWLTNSKPQKPGRLNDLRHIIYKSADTPLRRTKRNLALMMREGLLKENVDGEALAWAHSRLLQRPEQRRILMMISDGAPVDDSTLSVNSASHLELHLRHVIEEIESRSSVELIAIGIGHDVNSYYRRAVTITDPSELAGAMTEQLVELFDDKEKTLKSQPKVKHHEKTRRVRGGMRT